MPTGTWPSLIEKGPKKGQPHPAAGLDKQKFKADGESRKTRTSRAKDPARFAGSDIEFLPVTKMYAKRKDAFTLEDPGMGGTKFYAPTGTGVLGQDIEQSKSHLTKGMADPKALELPGHKYNTAKKIVERGAALPRKRAPRGSMDVRKEHEGGAPKAELLAEAKTQHAEFQTKDTWGAKAYMAPSFNSVLAPKSHIKQPLLHKYKPSLGSIAEEEPKKKYKYKLKNPKKASPLETQSPLYKHPKATAHQTTYPLGYNYGSGEVHTNVTGVIKPPTDEVDEQMAQYYRNIKAHHPKYYEGEEAPFYIDPNWRGPALGPKKK